MNATYLASGVLTLMMDKTTKLTQVEITGCQWTIAVICFLALFAIEFVLRKHLISAKAKKGF